VRTHSQTRRDFLIGSTGLVAGWAVARRAEAAQAPLVRKNLATLDARSPDIQAFSTAYQAMLQISRNDPRDPHGWTYQANMHGVSPSSDNGPDGLWNQCQHGTWWFFPWHRMYLYFFEKIIQKYSGSSTFALPYWQWDQPSGSQLVLNGIFLPGGPLYISQRSDAANGGQPIDDIDSILNDPRSGKNRAMSETRFDISANQPAFGGPRTTQPTHSGQLHGRLEGDGHDIIHVDVGGDTGLMSFPNLAARDPIFWFHHANVDRLWIEWLSLEGGRANPDPSTPSGKTWSLQKFTFFDENKNKVQMAPADVLDTTKLGYIYDVYPNFHPQMAALTREARAMSQESAQKPAERVAESREQGQTLGNTPLRLTLPLNERARSLVSRAAAHPDPAADPTRVHLTIHGIKAEANRGSIIRVYLNLAESENPPGIKDPRYAGSITLFRHEHDDMGLTATLPLNDALADLRKAGHWKDGDTLGVTLVQHRPSEKKEKAVKIPFDRVTLDVAE
jgi:tyrosinase